MKSPKDYKSTEILNFNPDERVQDCDRWRHVLASVLPERPKGTFFFNRLFDAVRADDVAVFSKACIGMLADASGSWQETCELWAACTFFASMFRRKFGDYPEWLSRLIDVCLNDLEENWKDDRRSWKGFVNGFAIRIEK